VDETVAGDLAALHRLLDERCRTLHAGFLPSRTALRKIADAASDAVAPRVLSPVSVRPVATKPSRVA
jgi:hypothetical protein